jgi:ribosomal protein L21E
LNTFCIGDIVYLSPNGTVTKAAPTKVGEFVHQLGVVISVEHDTVSVVLNNNYNAMTFPMQAPQGALPVYNEPQQPYWLHDEI